MLEISEPEITPDGSGGCEMEMSSCAEGSLEATSSGQSYAEQPESSDAVVHACGLTHKLYTIEEVSEDEEEEVEEEDDDDDEDVEEREDEDEGKKRTNDELGEGNNEEPGKAEAVKGMEENRRERMVTSSEEQVEAWWGEEKERQIKEETKETRDKVDEGGKKEEEAREMAESRQDVILYNAKPFDAPRKNMNVGGTLTITQGRHTVGEAVSDSADVSQQLTRAEKWAMRRHVGQWRNACASTGLSEAEADSKRMVRHSMPYGSVTGGAGLFFIGYSSTPKTLDWMLDRMAGLTPDGTADSLFNFTKPLTGTYFYVPSQVELQEIFKKCSK
ncbi:hypothetical protein SprV_0802485200 [Sparganum proliferum]